MPPIADATVLVIFGAAGDLTWRKLVPAIHHIHVDRELPLQFAVLGLDRKSAGEEAWRAHLREGVDQFADDGGSGDDWDSFSSQLHLLEGDFADPRSYAALAARLEALEERWQQPVSRIYYLAVPPQLVATIVSQLAAAGLAHGGKSTRLVVEKPFGHDLDSARDLDRKLRAVFEEEQIFRIDHYLGKETVQNILAFRFANGLFEPVWDQRYIQEVQITVSETVGVGHRASYYDHAGALRDMVQNHLLQLVCLVAMEPPVRFDAKEIRNKKVEVLQAIRPIPPGDVASWAVRAQYREGFIEGQRVPGYREEEGVNPRSGTETYAALKLCVDNWRWRGVPFHLRTGKRMASQNTEISIVFRPVPHQAFPAGSIQDTRPNRLLIRVHPNEGITQYFHAKRPGQTMRLDAVGMHFDYRDAFDRMAPPAYQTLLMDVMGGDATLFMRADQVEEAWAVVTPVLQAWSDGGNVPTYPAGSWGPDEAQAFLAREGCSWILPPPPRRRA